MNKLSILDIIRETYCQVEAPPPPVLANCALLLVDIQHIATPDYLHERAIKCGMEDAVVKTALADFQNRFEAAYDKCAAVLRAARLAGVPPVHIKIEALSATGRDVGPLHRRMGWCYPPGSDGAAFLPKVSPLPGEVVVTKTASGAFTGTNLDTVLRNMGIVHVFVCGFVADECVETTLRVALDHGYVAQLISDATDSYLPEVSNYVVNKFKSYGLAITSEELQQFFASLKR
jgi:nicotinamidase-related amidase